MKGVLRRDASELQTVAKQLMDGNDKEVELIVRDALEKLAQQRSGKGISPEDPEKHVHLGERVVSAMQGYEEYRTGTLSRKEAQTRFRAVGDGLSQYLGRHVMDYIVESVDSRIESMLGRSR